MKTRPTKRDYSLIGRDAQAAVENGLASAEWYQTDIPRKQMKAMMQRKDGPAIRDTILWFLFLGLSALGAAYFWGTWWCVPFFLVYGVLYGSASDSRWHECGHGTAFKTRWLNDVVYNIACFMIIREPTIWRWSHTRHHTDTIIVGRDIEIAVMRPPDIIKLLLKFIALQGAPLALRNVLLHTSGRLTVEEETFVPESEWDKVHSVARVWLVIHVLPIALALYLGSWLPVMFIGILPSMYGVWLSVYFGLTQHAGLAEDVLDHRLNTRTVYMNPVFRFVYLNMNYHIEHHMFPMVPYYALPQLHEVMKPDTPTPYASTIEAYREIIPTILRQMREPGWFARRELPPSAKLYRPDLHGQVFVTGD